ncbi:MAG TPA: hypothetical protein VER33_15700, partial [Polyangiaceae bacterium]|nr:hypothetical protein [Polyangiaceae bacterium]
DALFDHVLSFEDQPPNDDRVDAEELNVNAQHVDLDEDALAAHLAVSSLDALESRARRAAARNADETAESLH